MLREAVAAGGRAAVGAGGEAGVAPWTHAPNTPHAKRLIVDINTPVIRALRNRTQGPTIHRRTDVVDHLPRHGKSSKRFMFTD